MRIPTNPAIEQALQSGQLGTSPKVKGGGDKSNDFASMLMDVMEEVNGAQNNAQAKTEDFLTGRRPVDVDDLMIAVQKASTTMQLTLAVRNKVLEAYQEINRMQV